VPDRYELVLSYFNIGDSKKSEGLRARVAVRGEPERRGVNPVPGTSGLNRPSTGVPGDSSLDKRNDLNTCYGKGDSYDTGNQGIYPDLGSGQG
jgi:hypothetical protein